MLPAFAYVNVPAKDASGTGMISFDGAAVRPAAGGLLPVGEPDLRGSWPFIRFRVITPAMTSATAAAMGAA
jgi:hypothetical protein